jgi:carbamoyl-phosphate synthase large subunit
MKPLTILLTGCGAPGTSGTVMALRQNFDHRPVHIVGVDVNPDTPGQQLVDAFTWVLPPENIDYRTRLLDVCQRYSVDVVIPQTTREVGLLGGELEWFAEQGISVMASPAAELANNKRECLLRTEWSVSPIPAPSWESVLNTQELYAAVRRREPYPSVVKPCTSNGSRGVRIVMQRPWTRELFLMKKPSGLECTLEALLVTLCEGVVDEVVTPFPDLLVMDHLPGWEYSVDCFRGEHVQIAIPRIRRAMRDGISTDTAIADEPEMARHALTIAKRLGLIGVYGVQFKANAEGVPCLLEVNPRVQGTMAASVLAGANVIWMGVREVLGEPVTEVPTVRVGTRCVRQWVMSEWSDDMKMGVST